MSQQEWDDQFFGQVRLVCSKFAPEFLAVDQKSRRLVEYHDKKYMVTAWTPPDRSAYVEVEPIYEGTRSKHDPTKPPNDVPFKRTNETLEPDPQRRLNSSDIRRLLISAPAAPHPAAPRLQTPQLRTAPPRSWAMLVVALAGIASVGALLVAHLGPHRESAHPPAARIVPDAPAEGAAQQVGKADYFADELAGKRTASGEEFDNTEMTAACLHFPLGSRLRVTDLNNGRAVTVRVNDRGPWRPGFVITMTRRAAEELGFVRAGSARVKVEPVK
jgi:rare lipoprotein A